MRAVEQENETTPGSKITKQLQYENPLALLIG
jgi:hypothetical protein